MKKAEYMSSENRIDGDFDDTYLFGNSCIEIDCISFSNYVLH